MSLASLTRHAAPRRAAALKEVRKTELWDEELAWSTSIYPLVNIQLDDGWPESEKDVFQAALRMVVVKDSRWIVGEFYMSYGRIWCEEVRLITKRILGKGHQMTRVLQPQRERGRREREREWKGRRKKTWRNIMWATKMHRRLGTRYHDAANDMCYLILLW